MLGPASRTARYKALHMDVQGFFLAFFKIFAMVSVTFARQNLTIRVRNKKKGVIPDG